MPLLKQGGDPSKWGVKKMEYICYATTLYCTVHSVHSDSSRLSHEGNSLQASAVIALGSCSSDQRCRVQGQWKTWPVLFVAQKVVELSWQPPGLAAWAH